ncbi:MAG: DUF1080 domain-containing protein [Phycisphaerales bacterium]
MLSPLLVAAVLAIGSLAPATDAPWPMHDPNRPLPPLVDPGPAAPRPSAAPSDAIMLLGPGMDQLAWQSAWRSGSDEPRWTFIPDGGGAGVPVMRIAAGTGPLRTAIQHGDVQMRVEWRCPADQGHRTGQNRGNSGVFLMSTYELQVLQSRENETYADGMGGAIYGQFPPAVNAARPMGEWQAYDIVFRRPRFAADGSVEQPARMTVHFNGVLVHDAVELIGPASHRTQRPYAPHADALPLELQDHGEPIEFRSIWVRPLE